MTLPEANRTKLPIIPATPQSPPVQNPPRPSRIPINQAYFNLRVENMRLAAENAMLRELVDAHKAHSESLTLIVSQLIQNVPSQMPTITSLPPPPSYNETPPSK